MFRKKIRNESLSILFVCHIHLCGLVQSFVSLCLVDTVNAFLNISNQFTITNITYIGYKALEIFFDIVLAQFYWECRRIFSAV